MRRPTPLVLPLVLAAAVGALTACSAPAPAPTTTVVVPASSAPTVTSTATATATATTTATATASASASTDPDRPAGQCADSSLQVTFGQGDGAAGTDYIPIVFTNTGATSCVLRGAPGVSVVGGGDGAQLGEPADRDQQSARDVTLDARGGQAHATLAVVNIGANGGPLSNCHVVTGDGYRVYPPHSTRAYFVRVSGVRACDPTPVFMHVGVVASGASGGK